MTGAIAVAIAGLAIYLYGQWLRTPTVDEMIAAALADGEDEWAPWLRQVPDLDETPLYVESWAHIFRHQLDDPEAVERFLGGAA